MANGVLAGLFGGASPYPVDPQMQQGLLGDAGRAAGIALLSQAMNPNIGQGLAAALAAGRQTYQGGAQEAYQVGRQEEQDRAYREYQQSRAEAAQALSESRRAEAQAGAEEAEAQAERVDQAIAALRERDPDAAQRLDTAIKLFGIDNLPASMASLLEPPEPEKPKEPILRSVPGVGLVSVDPETLEHDVLVQQQYKPTAGGGAGEPEGLSPSRLSTRLGQLIDGLTRQYQSQFDMGEIDRMPPFHRIRSEAEQRLAQEVAAVGRAGGGTTAGGGGGQPPGVDVNQMLERVLQAAPEDKRDALRRQFEENVGGGANPADELAAMARVLGVL